MEFNYDLKVEQKIKENEKYFDLFLTKMKAEGLSKKTIERHLENSKLYVNDFLNYYEIVNMEDGLDMVSSFFTNFYIPKCLFATPTSLKETITSIIKFYKVMCDNGLVDKINYQTFIDTIKECKNDWLDELNRFDNDTIEE